jgi:putative transposase
LLQDGGNQRFLWNALVAENKRLYEAEGNFLFFTAAHRFSLELKKTHEFLKLGNSQALQATCLAFDTCLKQAIKNVKQKTKRANAGFPTFKQKNNRYSMAYPQYVTIEDGFLNVPKVKTSIKLNKSGKDFPKDFNTTTIIREASGKWYASFVVPFTQPEPVELTPESRFVGVDLNSVNFVVSSDGEFISNPKYLSKSERNLKKYQRRHARTKSGSKNREKARLKLARQYEAIKNRQEDFVNKTALQLLKENDCVFIEDLNVKSMQRFNGRMILQAPFGLFRNKLTSKAKMLGKHVVAINRWYPSSKTCSCCGEVMPDLSLDTRWISCKKCGLEMDRDINAAMNILNEGLRIISTAGTAGYKACGDHDLLPDSLGKVGSMKQEVAFL